MIPIKKYRQQNDEVMYTRDALTTVNKLDIGYLSELSSLNSRKRIRLCAHYSQDNLLHEMLIVHDKNAYVRPHKHPGKSESTHIIKGLVDVVLFDNSGKIERVISMGDYASGKIFYYRIDAPIFHTLLIRSEVLVFHEVTNGPFKREDTIFAPWSPEDADVNSVSEFISDLHNRINLVV